MPATTAPVASYDDASLLLNRDAQAGQRGYSGVLGSVTTALAGANNDLVISAKEALIPGTPISVQYVVFGRNAPLWLYENGLPARYQPSANLGFQLIAKFPGTRGNFINFTLIDPLLPSPLKIANPNQGSIVVILARSSSAVTTTPAQLVAAINNTSPINQWVLAYVSDSTVITPLSAMPMTYLTGGAPAPGVVTVSLANNNNGTITSTANNVLGALKGSSLVQAALASGNNGTGLVTVMGLTPIPVTQGRGSLGVLDQDSSLFGGNSRRFGVPFGKETNNTIEVQSDRQGAMRTLSQVPAQDRAIIGSSSINHTMEHKPRSPYL